MRAQKLEDDHRIKARQYSIEGNETYANKHRAEAQLLKEEAQQLLQLCQRMKSYA